MDVSARLWRYAVPLNAIIITAVLQIPCTPTPIPAVTPALTVEVVDEGWVPLPGITVLVTAKEGTRKSWHEQTDSDGRAHFSVPPNAEYDIEASAVAFKKERRKAVKISGGPDVGARVQIRVLISGPRFTVY